MGRKQVIANNASKTLARNNSVSYALRGFLRGEYTTGQLYPLTPFQNWASKDVVSYKASSVGVQ